MLDLQARHQRLIDGSDGDAGGEVALGCLRRPPCVVVLLVGPQHREGCEPLPVLVAGAQVARHREHRPRGIGAVDAGEVAVDPPVQLRRCGAGRDSEVQPVDLAAGDQPEGAPQGRLGLARTGFGLEGRDGAKPCGGGLLLGLVGRKAERCYKGVGRCA